MNLLKDQKTVGIVTILSGLIAVACMIALLIGVNFNSDLLSDPLLVLSASGVNTTAIRWSMILDIFGYYLLLIPVIYLMQDWMRERSAWSKMVTFCGLAYVLIGSIGASILAVVWPRIMTAFPVASIAEQSILRGNFILINDIVYNGMWNLLEMTFAAVWWTFFGYQLRKNKFRFIGWLTILTGISCMGDAISGILEIPWLHELSLNIYLLLAIVWAIAMGIFLIKRPLK